MIIQIEQQPNKRTIEAFNRLMLQLNLINNLSNCDISVYNNVIHLQFCQLFKKENKNKLCRIIFNIKDKKIRIVKYKSIFNGKDELECIEEKNYNQFYKIVLWVDEYVNKNWQKIGG